MSNDGYSLGPGQRIGAYEVRRTLGCGGSGEVYAVLDPLRARQIALKLLPRATLEARPDCIQPFQREYHRLQLLRHPRIVEVYRNGTDAAGLYYTMELLDGPELKSLLPLPWRQACSLLRDVALSLAIVHARGLIHRDVAPSNVRCTRDGRAKLLDFGATVSMGIPRSIVGTPPCIPPEAFEYEPLDARADLYGLGALGYCMLTGSHAFPASTFDQLTQLWDAPLQPASARASDVPPALDDLIGLLLQRDRRLRPVSATVVINHLEAIAELPPLPANEAAQSSFVAPALVGRLAELDMLGFHVAAAREGRGSAVLIEAAQGLGRTRLLQQLVVEASQRDVLVVAADANHATARGHEVSVALGSAVLEQTPSLSLPALREQERTIASLLEELRRAKGARTRRDEVGALGEALLALTRHVTLIVLVDDIQRCDEPSAALLASLAERAQQHRLLLVATKQVGAPVRASASLQRLALSASRIMLRPLAARAIEELVRSAFVDAPQAKFVAEWVGSLSEGNPGKIVELLRHLVERDLVEFRDGAWVLPEAIDPALLPHDVAAALRARIDALSSFARELVELLCVFVRPATLDELAVLAELGEPKHESSALFGALDELTGADVIAGDGQSSFVVRSTLREIVLNDLSATQLRRAHGRVGRALAHSIADERYDRAASLPAAYLWGLAGYHLLLAGERERGTRLWSNSLRYAFEVDHVPIWDGNIWYHAANLLALSAAEELQFSESTLSRLRTGVVQSAIHGDPSLVQHGERLLPELERAAGALDADPVAAGGEAIQRAIERWQSTPAAERGVHPYEAITLLVIASFSLACIYGYTLDSAALAPLARRLTCYGALFPSCASFQKMIEAILAGVTGRSSRELALRLENFDDLASEAIRATVPETSRQHARGYTLYAIATLEAARDPARGLSRVVQMEAETPFMTYGIWQVRLLAHVYDGNDVEAQACAERMEISAVQDGAVTKYQLHASGLQNLAAAYALAGDVMGLRATIDKLQPFAAALETWQPFYDAARAHYHRLRGQLTAARELAQAALLRAAPGVHRGYGFAVLALLRALLDANDLAAADGVAACALEHTRREQLGPELEVQLSALHALVLSRRSAFAEAGVRARAALACALEHGIEGLLLGDVHHNLAQAALLERDTSRFELHAALSAQHSCAHQHPVSMARHKRLLAGASASALAFSAALAGGASLVRPIDLRSMLLTELERKSSARSLPERVLELMLDRSGANAGYLFGLEDDRLRLLAASEDEVPDGLADALQSCFAEERPAARAPLNTQTATVTSIVRVDTGQLFQVVILNRVDEDGALSRAGALALRVQEDIPAIPRFDCLLALSTVLDGGRTRNQNSYPA